LLITRADEANRRVKRVIVNELKEIDNKTNEIYKKCMRQIHQYQKITGKELDLSTMDNGSFKLTYQ
jgi:hypothetical protein